jgi:hypothetical protein
MANGMDAEREAAAMKLQAHFRGMKARSDLKKKREEAYSELKCSLKTIGRFGGT